MHQSWNNNKCWESCVELCVFQQDITPANNTVAFSRDWDDRIIDYMRFIAKSFHVLPAKLYAYWYRQNRVSANREVGRFWDTVYMLITQLNHSCSKGDNEYQWRSPKFDPPHQHLYLPHYKSPTALSHMHHLTCGISSLLHFVNLILFTVILVHLILRISPHHSHHPPSLPSPITASTFHSRLKTHLFHKSFPP